MIEWSNDQVLKFIELYRIERLLWDPSHKDHKKKHKVHDAWTRISKNLENTIIEELKSKKKSLMATFQPLLKKKKMSLRSGTGADEVFQPIWFAFDAMESFLGTVYDVEETINTEVETEQTDEVESLTQDLGQNKENEEEGKNEENIANRKTPDDTKTKAYASRKRRTVQAFDTEVVQKQLNDSFKTLNRVLQSKQPNLEDDCDLYDKLLATKLKRYSEDQRQRIMYKIDGLLLDNPPETCSSSPFSSSSASRPSSDYTPQDSPVYSHHSQSPVYSHHSQSPVYSHHSQSPAYSHHSQPSVYLHHSLPSLYSQLSQPSSIDSRYYQKPSTSSQLSPLHMQVMQVPLQENSRTTPYSSHPSPAQSSQPSPLHLQPNLDLPTTRNIIESAFVDVVTENDLL